ncbi:MAG: hypothetical protein JW814_00600 [Candidatus Krumholzibacteriota bacterium]|nr:hypothetical protein [Candidatus Krumholzibacteriota bacterium]
MKRVLLTVAIALLIPGLLGAADATLGLYSDGKLHYQPSMLTSFQLHLFLVQSDYYVTAIEYLLLAPDANFQVQSVEYPSNQQVSIGSPTDPLEGHAISYWPPMTGFPDGYDLMATLNCITVAPCELMPDYPLLITVNPESGELRGTYYPENETFPIIGLTTYLCLDQIAVEDGTWGAIKSLYK